MSGAITHKVDILSPSDGGKLARHSAFYCDKLWPTPTTAYNELASHQCHPHESQLSSGGDGEK